MLVNLDEVKAVVIATLAVSSTGYSDREVQRCLGKVGFTTQWVVGLRAREEWLQGDDLSMILVF